MNKSYLSYMGATGRSAIGSGTLEEGKALIRSGDWPSALALFNGILGSVDEAGTFHSKDLVEAYQSRGFVLCRMSRFKESVADYMRALEMAGTSGDKAMEAESLRGLGYVHYVMGDPNMAMEFYEKAYAMLAAEGDAATIGRTLIEIGNVHNQAGRQEMAIRKYQEASKKLSGLGPSDQMSRAHYNTGDSLMKLNRTEEAAEELEKCIAICERLGPVPWKDWARTLLALCLARKGRPKEARAALADSVESLRNKKDVLGESQAIMVQGVISSVEGDFDKALEEVDRSIKMARDFGHAAMVAEALQEKGGIFVRKGDKEAARNAFAEAKAAYKDVGNDHAATEVEEQLKALGY